MHIIKHFFTITKHRHKVMRYCFKCGLIKQGLLHDLSKYSPTEFFRGAKYYAGKYSPHHNERNEKGYSMGWMHHKGRNKHHAEFWYDYNIELGEYAPVPMPDRYIAESLCDRVAACKIYNKKNFKITDPVDYFMNHEQKLIIHEESKRKLHFLLQMYADKGQKETFKYIKKHIRKKIPLDMI